MSIVINDFLCYGQFISLLEASTSMTKRHSDADFEWSDYFTRNYYWWIKK